MRVDLVWSMDAGRYAHLHIPHGITLVEFEEFEQAIKIQLRGVRRGLEITQDKALLDVSASDIGAASPTVKESL